MKEMLKAGDGYAKPQEISTVTAHYTVSLADGTQIHSTSSGEPQTFLIDDPSVLQGLFAAINTMKKGEHAKFVIAPKHAYGAQGNGDLKIPANAALHADINLINFENEKDSYDLKTGEEKFAAADRLRELGNEYFKKGDAVRAVRRYKKSLSYAESEYGLSDDEKKTASNKKLLAHLNIAAAYLKANDFKEARESSTKALAIDAANAKGLFRRGTALLELGEWDEARKDLKRALEIEPGNTAAQAALHTLQQRVAKQAESDRKRYKGMFERMSKLSAKEEAAKAEAEAAKAASAAVAAAPSPSSAPVPAQTASMEAAAPGATAESPAPMEATSSDTATSTYVS